MKNSKPIQILAYVVLVGILMWLGFYGFSLGIYVVYSNVLTVLILSLANKKLHMAYRTWRGVPGVAIAVVMLIIVTIGGLSYEGFNYFYFVISIPFGAALGWKAFKLPLSTKS